MKAKSMLMAVLVAVAASAQAQVNSIPSQPHLLVKGQAEREVKPDRFTITIALSRIDFSPERARTLVQEDAARILNAFKDCRALSDSIEASTLSIQPQYQYEQNKQVFKGTQVSRSLVATFGDLADVRRFLARTETSESVRINGIGARYSGEAEVRAELKREAAERSRASAEGLAKAYGTRIVGLYTISDVAPDFAYGVQAGTWPGSPTAVNHPAPPAPQPDIGASVDQEFRQVAEYLEAGNIKIYENVYAIFLIGQ
ncbi:MAG: SIMPL domain-containing protein [Pseudoxanthomonas sp.]